MSRICTNCAAEVPEGVRICENCGMPVSEMASSQEAPPQKAPAQPPQTPLAEESTSDRRSQLEQGERLPSSQATPLDSAPAQDRDRGRQRRGVPRWLIKAAGFVGTAVAGLVGMAAFWRRDTEALEQSPTADSATQQSMGVAEAAVQDSDPTDQGEAERDLVEESAPATATVEPVAPGAPLDPNLLDEAAPGPTLDTGLVGQVEQTVDLVNVVNRNPELVNAINQNPEGFINLWHQNPQFLQLCYQNPHFVNLCYQNPYFIDLCYQHPEFINLCYYYPDYIDLCHQHPHYIQISHQYPNFIDLCHQHPQFIYVWRQYADLFQRHPELIDTMEEHPDLVDLMQRSPSLLDALNQNPDMVDALNQDPEGFIDAVQENPALIAQMRQDPAAIDELGTTATAAPPSPDATPPDHDAGTQIPTETPPFGAEDLLEQNPDLFDPEGPGPTIDQSLVDESAPGPTVPAAWFDPEAPGPTVPAEWFDPASPGPTVDLNMLEDPNTLDLVAEAAQDPSADPNEFVQSRMESSGGVTADAGGVTAGTSLTEPGVLEQGATDHQGLDDTVNP